MLDEPAAGLSRSDTDQLAALFRQLAGFNIAVMLVEHDMKLVMSISDHIVVINQGRPLAAGTPDEIKQNPDVIKAYLGET